MSIFNKQEYIFRKKIQYMYVGIFFIISLVSFLDFVFLTLDKMISLITNDI